MNNKAASNLLPKLRFPNFTENWNLIRLSESVDKNIKWSFIGGPFGSSLQSSDYTSDGVRIIQLQNIGDGEFNDEYKIYTSTIKADELLSCNIYPGEIILSKMGDPVGRACIMPESAPRYVMCSDGIRLVVDENKFNKYFVFSLINSKHFRANVQNHATGSTRKRIGLEVLRNLPMAVPNKDEQDKIADCLFSLDKLITAEEQKLSTLIKYKKGLIQKLFPIGLKTTSQWRFAEFRNCKQWDEKPFKSYIKLYRGSSPRPIENYLTKDNGVNWIKIGDTKNADGFIIRNVEEKITQQGAEKSRFVDVGELILANSMSYGKTYQLAISGCIYDGWFVLREYEKYFAKNFLLQLLNSENLQMQYAALSAGGVVQNISSDIVYATILKKPEIDEQEKIANFLISVDNIIVAQIKKVKELKQHKKGLMQVLFPSVQEVAE